MSTTPKRTRPSGNIHTPLELARKARRLNRYAAGVERLLGEMRRGASLHLNYSPRRHWRLSTGIFVPDEVARVVIELPSVAACGDALFACGLSQTFRHISEDKEEANG